MSDIPNLLPPKPDFRGYHWHHQFTIPLLFDDCLSLLQKVCALWNKLNVVIDSLNDFNDEFNKWATSVETQLKDLYEKYEALNVRVTNCENDIKNIKTTLENIQNTLNDFSSRLSTVESNIKSLNTSVTQNTANIAGLRKEFNSFRDSVNISINNLTNRILDLEGRVDNLENLLNNLKIIPPQTILDLTNDDATWTTIWGNWWDWFCANIITFADGDSKSNWQISLNLKWHDTVTKPKRTIQIGYLGQLVALVKLPFIAVRKSVWDHFPSGTEIAKASPNFKAGALYPSVGFFDLTLTKEFYHTIDEVKLMTSYIPFLTQQSQIVKKVAVDVCRYTYAVQTDIRLQVPKTGKSAKLAIVPQQLTIAVVPNNEDVSKATAWDMYIYCIAENG